MEIKSIPLYITPLPAMKKRSEKALTDEKDDNSDENTNSECDLEKVFFFSPFFRSFSLFSTSHFSYY
jgi:hypothetical protein